MKRLGAVVKRDRYGGRMVLGVYVWQWIVGLLVLIGVNLMITVPLAISAYEQTHATHVSYWRCEPR